MIRNYIFCVLAQFEGWFKAERYETKLHNKMVDNTRFKTDENYQWRNVGNQYLGAVIGKDQNISSRQPCIQYINQSFQYIANISIVQTANIIFMSHGCMNGWISPATPYLLSDESPLKTGPLTNEQLSWIGSMAALGGVIGTFTFGFIIVYFGCKRAMLFLTIPSITFWILIYFGDTYYHILIARFFNGWLLTFSFVNITNKSWLRFFCRFKISK